MNSCDLKEHLFEKGGTSAICSKCSKTFEDYQKDLMSFIDGYRANKKS
jgi:hypothetical protein